MSQHRQAEVGSHFGHPQGVQVKAANVRFQASPSKKQLIIPGYEGRGMALWVWSDCWASQSDDAGSGQGSLEICNQVPGRSQPSSVIGV